MKILVTGAAGYIGRHVVMECLEAGHEVYASDYTFKGIDGRAKNVETSIFSEDRYLYENLGSPDVLIHLAWRNGFIHNSASHMADLSNHVGFLNYMIDRGVKYVSVMGSMHEVGYWEGKVEADTPCNPMTMYGIAKNALRQELMLYAENKDVSIHWLRGFYIYGDDSKGSSIFSKILEACEAGKKEFPFTSGKNKYDFISVYELSRMIMMASTQNKYNGIINVCSGIPISLGDKIESYIKENALPIRLCYGAFADRPYDSPEIWGDSTIIKHIMDDYRRNGNAGV